jgi:hypothetical protein
MAKKQETVPTPPETWTATEREPDSGEMKKPEGEKEKVQPQITEEAPQ